MMKVILLQSLLLVAIFHSGLSQDGYATRGDGTTGGAGGSTVNVCTEAELNAAVAGDTPKIVKITCHINLSGLVRPGSNKSILGANGQAGVSGSGFYIRRVKNVIIRGLRIFKSVAPDDGISIDQSTNVWVDHNEFYSDLTHDKDYYDGLLDVKHAADWITVSWNKFHTHYKASLVGHSDSNGGEDTGKLHITYHHNWFLDCNSRLPSIRFGTGHIYNNLYENAGSSGINSRMGAQVLVEGNIFSNINLAVVTNLDSSQEGGAIERNNQFSSSPIRITKPGNLTSLPYSYQVEALNVVGISIRRGAGATLQFP